MQVKRYYERKKFSDSSLYHIFETENFRKHFGQDDGIKKGKIIQCQLSWLAANYGWIAEEPERWDRTSACKGRHSFSHFSRCFDHTSSTQTDKDTSQIHHDFGAYVPYSVSNNATGSFTSPSNWSTRMTNDAIIWTEKGWKGVSQLAWSHQFS